MLKNINIHLHFSKSKNKNCAYFCVDQQRLKQFLFINEIINTPEIDLNETTIQVQQEKKSHQGLLKLLPNLPLVMVAHNVSNEYQLKTWLQIKGKTFVPNEDWSRYLYSKNLLEPWIDGELQGLIGSGYTEASKAYGYRTRYQEMELIDSFKHDIWSFSELYNGVKKHQTGYYDNYWYQTEKRIILLRYGEKTFEVNEQWKKDFIPSENVVFFPALRQQ